MLKKYLFIFAFLLFSSNVMALSVELDKPVVAYDEPSKAGNKIHLFVAEPVELLRVVGDYYEATSRFQTSAVFYIPKSDITLTSNPNLVSGTDIVLTALNYLGTPYVYGGSSLETGVDCSSFTQLIYRMHGISLLRTSKEQFQTNGFFVDEASLQPGDLVFFGTTTVVNDVTTHQPQHLGIYIGDGKMVHASTSVRGVVIDGIKDRGFPPIIGFKRIIPSLY